MTLIITSLSGTIIVTPLKRTLRFSGSSYLPAYPGFIVMKYPHEGISFIFSDSSGNINSVWPDFFADVIDSTYIATTDNTSKSILLNSSKQPHRPDWHNPLNIFAMSVNLCSEEQLVTTTNIPKVLPRSLTVSVFPVPAGPAGAPP